MSIDFFNIKQLIVGFSYDGVNCLILFEIHKVSDIDRTAVGIGQVRSETVALSMEVICCKVGLHMILLLKAVGCDTKVHSDVAKNITEIIIVGRNDLFKIN